MTNKHRVSSNHIPWRIHSALRSASPHANIVGNLSTRRHIDGWGITEAIEISKASILNPWDCVVVLLTRLVCLYRSSSFKRGGIEFPCTCIRAVSSPSVACNIPRYLALKKAFSSSHRILCFNIAIIVINPPSPLLRLHPRARITYERSPAGGKSCELS